MPRKPAHPLRAKRKTPTGPWSVGFHRPLSLSAIPPVGSWSGGGTTLLRHQIVLSILPFTERLIRQASGIDRHYSFPSSALTGRRKTATKAQGNNLGP